MTTRRTWQEILAQEWGEASDEYGPHTHEVWSALDALGTIPGLVHVGEPIPDNGVVAVGSWDDVFAIFFDLDGKKYGPNGHLIEPVRRVREIIDSPELGEQWKAARGGVIKYVGIDGLVPDWMEDQELTGNYRTKYSAIYEYLYEHISWLLAEIIGMDRIRSTYFREQFEWIVAGHLPCGWAGDWPVGKLRVF